MELNLLLFLSRYDKDLLSDSDLNILKISCNNFWSPMNGNYIEKYSTGIIYIFPLISKHDIELIYSKLKKNKKYSGISFLSILSKY